MFILETSGIKGTSIVNFGTLASALVAWSLATRNKREVWFLLFPVGVCVSIVAAIVYVNKMKI